MKRIVFIIISIVLLMGICTLRTDKNEDNTYYEVQGETCNTENTTSEVIWFDYAVNLDGDRTKDDSIVIESVNKDGRYNYILSVTLENGLTDSIMFEGRSDSREDCISVSTGKVYSNNKDSIVIQITNATSNYGSSDIHVLNVDENKDKISIVETLTILDQMELSDSYKYYEKSVLSLELSSISMTNEKDMIRYLDKIGTSAIRITEYMNDDLIYVYWNGSEWRLVE